MMTVTHPNESERESIPGPEIVPGMKQVWDRLGCPKCGNCDVSKLIWVNEECVECFDCGYRYDPMEMQGGTR